ncbi:MAG TPA: hypothetical protein ENK50_10220 [Sedimenticola sp.]|nr:hypothetical protein [Sedimenticola sp.]
MNWMPGEALDLERVERRLAAADQEELTGSEAHGVVCGLLCTGQGDEGLARWLQELFPRSDDGEGLQDACQRTLRLLYEETREAIEGPGLGFTPLLPGDDKPLRQRAGAVCDWCQGFLYGVGLAGHAREQVLSAHTREALQDMSDITRMDLDALEENEESEEDLMQITEFIWVAAMLVYEDLSPDETARP